MARLHGIDIHLGQTGAAIIQYPPGNNFQALDLGFGLFAPVRFDVAHHHVHAFA